MSTDPNELANAKRATESLTKLLENARIPDENDDVLYPAYGFFATS